MGPLNAIIGWELLAALRRRMRAFLLYGLAVILALMAGGFGLSALHRTLAAEYHPVEADLIIGLLLLGLAGLVLVLAMLLRRPRKPVLGSGVRTLVAPALLTFGRTTKLAPLVALAAFLAARYGNPR